MRTMHTAFIINPVAGRQNATEHIRQMIASEGLDPAAVKLYITRRSGDAQEITARLGQRGEPCLVFACGGDGTLNEVVNGAFGYPCLTVGVLPFGTGNDFIAAFTSLDAARDLGRQLAGEDRLVDLIQVNGRVACNLCSCGFDADVAYQVGAFKRLPFVGGAMAYILSVLWRLLRKMPMQVQCAVDGRQVFSGSCTLAAIANGRSYGGGFLAAPHADLADGQLELVLVKKVGRLKFLQLVGSYRKGLHIQNGQVGKEYAQLVEAHSARSCTITASTQMPFVLNIDGECAPVTEAAFQVLPGALRVRVPAR